jgi:hypothetical protein
MFKKLQEVRFRKFERVHFFYVQKTVGFLNIKKWFL